jgi:DNA-binding Xre family transcriptional regulator
MIIYNKLMNRLKKKGITPSKIRQYNLMSQSTLTKIKMCTGTIEEIESRLKEYRDTHNGKDFSYEISSKTIEDLCQLLQCQPKDILEWTVMIDPNQSYEQRFKE